MADAFYEEFRNGMFGGGVHAQPDLTTAAITVFLRDEGALALNLATQIDFADTTAGKVGTEQAVTSPTVGTAGVGAFDHALVTFTSVTGASVESLDYFDDATAVDATAPMICNIDSATGLPVTPNGGNITWDPAAGGVFQIT